MINIEELKFDEKGLIPAIVTDAESKKVLTLAYMNKESLEISLREKKTCFGPDPEGAFGVKGKPAAITSTSSASRRTATEML